MQGERCGAGLILLGLAWGWGMGLEAGQEPFRLAFSTSKFSDVHENDAKAAVMAWARTFAEEQGAGVDPQAMVFSSLDEMREGLIDGTIDMLSVVTEEYYALQAVAAKSPLLVTVADGRDREEVVLLVHRESGLEAVEDLAGGTLVLHRNPRASLALPWLDGVLLERGLPVAQEFVGDFRENAKLTGVVLPVFFRKVDACLVTRGAFETMSELNPQVGRDLVEIAVSPALVPTVIFFRKDYDSPQKETILASLNRLDDSVAGRQVLAIFRSERLAEQPRSYFQEALDVIERTMRLRAGERP
ncbi:MAG TPA: PhnD/SsuA/transferrin family substrate-binding protein [Kiritimatiellia bacterium]|nr:PhnD/SsuA/transferrin family substrate-binding protein [Kiritimatiellia bacterium]